jgi:hypothetical protein
MGFARCASAQGQQQSICHLASLGPWCCFCRSHDLGTERFGYVFAQELLPQRLILRKTFAHAALVAAAAAAAAVAAAAGLTHDLGHGPFSHVFEKELLPRLGLAPDIVRNWEHETMSNRILDHLLNDSDNDIDLQVGHYLMTGCTRAGAG